LGQKVNPVGLRLGITRKSFSNWYSDDNVADFVKEDLTIRSYLKKRLKKSGIVFGIYREKSAESACRT